jgi:hypothetical protein
MNNRLIKVGRKDNAIVSDVVNSDRQRSGARTRKKTGKRKKVREKEKILLGVPKNLAPGLQRCPQLVRYVASYNYDSFSE